jgi:organic hydroperoxide reductase OsmC/OhrA
VSRHVASVEWARGDQTFAANRYSRAHDCTFDGGAVVRASAAPTRVAVLLSDPAAVDPEEAFVAALSSCHMLFFLAFAAKAGLIVDRNRDDAVGELGTDDRWRTSMTVVTLCPVVDFTGQTPEMAALDELHHRAHAGCYIANSVRTEVRIEPR